MFKVICFYFLICSINGEKKKYEYETTHPEFVRVNKLRQKELTGAFNFQPYMDTVTLPARREVQMNVTSKFSVIGGPIIHDGDLLKKPRFTWQNNASNYYSFFLTRNTLNFKYWGYEEYHNWIVVNIPGDDIEKGEQIMCYLPPVPDKDKTNKFPPIYKAIVYLQPGYVKMPHMIWFTMPRTWHTVANFTQDYGLGKPWAWSIFYVANLRDKLGLGNETIASGNVSCEATYNYTRAPIRLNEKKVELDYENTVELD